MDEIEGIMKGSCDGTECSLAKMADRLSRSRVVEDMVLNILERSYDERSVLLWKEPEVWVLAWKIGDDTTIHDHGRSVAGVKILKGIIKEEMFLFAPGIDTRSGEEFNVRKAVRTFYEGTLLSIPTPYIHRFSAKEDAISLHVYSPGLKRQAYFNEMFNHNTLAMFAQDRE